MGDFADIRPSILSALVFLLMHFTLVPFAKYLVAKYKEMIPDSVEALVSMG